MIGRTHRFHGYGSLRGVYQRGKTARTPLMNLRYAARNPDNKPYRVAVVVSRKVSKSAVTRNRIRRRVYEAVRAGGTDIKPGTDLVFTVFSDQLAILEAPKLQDTVTGLLEKVISTPAERR
jgi:ribonuclease P protein component